MVECESGKIANMYGSIVVLIDTWWNVNMLMVTRTKAVLPVLIDTWWNVND